MERTKNLMQPKWDTLKKHEGGRKATKNMFAYYYYWYMARNSQHKKNVTLFNAKAPDIVSRILLYVFLEYNIVINPTC